MADKNNKHKPTHWRRINDDSGNAIVYVRCEHEAKKNTPMKEFLESMREYRNHTERIKALEDGHEHTKKRMDAMFKHIEFPKEPIRYEMREMGRLQLQKTDRLGERLEALEQAKPEPRPAKIEAGDFRIIASIGGCEWVVGKHGVFRITIDDEGASIWKDGGRGWLSIANIAEVWK